MLPFSRQLSTISGDRATAIFLWLIGAAYADSFVRNGVRKFDAEGFWSHSFLETWGFPLWFMYFIGVLEVVGGILLLIPKVRHWGSAGLAVIMLGALATRSIFGAINGIPLENAYSFFQDVLFFLSSISMFLYYVALWYRKEGGKH